MVPHPLDLAQARSEYEPDGNEDADYENYERSKAVAGHFNLLNHPGYILLSLDALTLTGSIKTTTPSRLFAAAVVDAFIPGAKPAVCRYSAGPY